jgi:hypothetical protein
VVLLGLKRYSRAPCLQYCDVVRFLQLSDPMEYCLQSNVKDVVRLIARLLWGTKVGSWGGGVSCSSLTRFVGTGPFGLGQGRRTDGKVTAWTATGTIADEGLQCELGELPVMGR